MTFSELVEAVSQQSGEDKGRVEKVLKTLGAVVTKTVLEGEAVKFRAFGTFYPVTLKPRRLWGSTGVSAPRRNIRFRQCRSTPSARRSTVDKFGVEYDNTKTKTASVGQPCPGCGAKLVKERYCDNCGTKPFEKKPETK